MLFSRSKTADARDNAHAGQENTARQLLITLFLIERGVLPTPLLYLSAFFEASRRDYYDGLRGTKLQQSPPGSRDFCN